MVKLVIENLGFGTLRLDEIERKGQSYTYDTLLNIRQESPDAKLFLSSERTNMSNLIGGMKLML